MGISKITKGIAERANSVAELAGNNWIVNQSAKILKYDESGMPVAFSARGKAIVAGLAVPSALYSAVSQRMQNDMGTTDGKIYTNTPDYSSYTKQTRKGYRDYVNSIADADGSLVFALDRTKNGGFL